MSLFQKIKEFLDQHQVNYKVIEHSPTPTSEDSARLRGEPLKIGAKALVLKTDDSFLIVVIPANCKLDTKKLKKILHTRNLRFATPDELHEKTGCEKGAVPPFGELVGLPIIVDGALFEEEYMAFNAGSLEKSIKMKTADYQKIIQPRVDSFSTSVN
ncbi:hypothetical protein HYU22_02160 [Candidatus Woesearchaeota archaeon]|nr:hypothetical protein [Candidatus Woesearchaeota archaeon]